jgi:hypothetical protein
VSAFSKCIHRVADPPHLPTAALLVKSFPFGERLRFACEGLQVHVLPDNDKTQAIGYCTAINLELYVRVEIGVQGHWRGGEWRERRL